MVFLTECNLPDIEYARQGRQRQFSNQVRELLQQRYDHPPLAFVHSFGCQQNASDAEKLMGMLAEMGFGFTDQPADADFILFNTCAVRENAEDKVLGNVGALKKQKKSNPDLIIGLCGCMMQQPHVVKKIRSSYPYVDLIFGTHVSHTLPEMVYSLLSGASRRVISTDDSSNEIAEGLPVRREDSIKAWLPIMNGCDNFCTYCIVPYVRGRERSRTPENILAEARELVAQGYKEITLLGQNVNSYGKGLPEPINFAQLLRQINAIPGDFWIRFMTSHPKDCTYELLDAIRDCEKVCKYVHLPVQSGSDRVLKAMNRHYTIEHYLDLIRYAKENIPGIRFSSDIIVGFPGETREEFEETLDMIREVKYDRLFTFIYSPRTGTRAASMDDPIPAEEKSHWLRELLEVQNEIGDAQLQPMDGKVFKVLAEGPSKLGEGYLCGHTEQNIIVDFKAPESVTGSFVPVRVTKVVRGAAVGELQS